MKCPHCAQHIEDRQTTWAHRRLAAGRCVRCGRAHPDTTWYCRPCRLFLAEQARRRYHRRHPGSDRG